jgi:DNA-binding response OmpR family regulator
MERLWSRAKSASGRASASDRLDHVGAKHRILAVEDDPRVATGIVAGVRDAGFDVELVTTGEAAVRAIVDGDFDLVVLDINLPDFDGFDVLRRISGKSTRPVIVLTARTELDERIQAFRLGAVDFVPKPFFMQELVARIEARLRIAKDLPARVVRWQSAVLDIDGRTLSIGDKPVQLTRHELDLLAYLALRPNRAVPRAVLAESVLDPLAARDERTIDSHVAHIRKKLGAEGAALVTVWGIGYRFDPAGR